MHATSIKSVIPDVAALAAEAAFGRPLITNTHRGLIAEAIIARELGPDWLWCSADYAAWDFERQDGTRLEVKQAASRQSWHAGDEPPSSISFDIRKRKGRYEGSSWVAEQRRWADLYVFAHHFVTDASADHRDPAQWAFYVVPECELPNQETLALSRVRSLSQAYAASELRSAVVLCSGATSRSR